MVYNEQVGYSSQLVAIYSEMVGRASRLCRSRFDITLSEYALLLLLHSRSEALLTRQIADFLMLRIGTVWQMTSSLEERGLLRRDNARHDRRLAACSLSEKGKIVAGSCNLEIRAILDAVFGSSLSEDEFYAFHDRGIGHSLDALRGFAVDLSPRTENDSAMRVEFTTFVTAMLNRWHQCTVEECGLTLTQFRLLHFIAESESARVQDAAEHLIISRSRASACKRHLCEVGMLVETSHPTDRRSALLTPTQKGRGAVASVLPALDKLTVPAHSLDSERGTAMLRAWHARMYYNLRNYQMEMLESD